MKKFILSCICMFIVCSCQINKTERFYCSQFMQYLNEIGIAVDSAEYYYAVHLQGCNSCIRSSLDFLESLDNVVKRKLLVLFVGDYVGNDMECFKMIETLKNEISYIEDSHQRIFSYQTGFAYPLFIKIKNGKCKMYEEMADKKYHDEKLLHKII